MTHRLQDAEKQAEESERARRVLEDRGQTDDDRLSRLNSELADVERNRKFLERVPLAIMICQFCEKIFNLAGLQN